MTTSEPFAELAAAFVLAQKEIEGAAKDSVNPAFGAGRKYADLTSVSDACRPALNKHDIAVIQTPIPTDKAGTLGIQTTFLHKSGQWMRGELFIPVPKADPQGYGSALTYARRYHLSAMAGVCPEDDDAEGAMDRGGKAPPNRPPQRPAPTPPANRQPPQRPTPTPPAPAPSREIVNEGTGEVTPAEPHDAGEPELASEARVAEIRALLDKHPKAFAQKLVNEACRHDGATKLAELTTPAADRFLAQLRTLKVGTDVKPPANPKQSTAA